MKTNEAKVLAERHLLYSLKNSHAKKTVIFCVLEPYSEEVYGQGDAAFICTIRIDGIDEQAVKYVGMDAVQALQLAADLDPLISRLSKKYDFFWATGEPYFEIDMH